MIMAVDMRERPVVKGRDAQKFIDRSKRNKLGLAKKVIEKALRSEEYDRNQVFRHIQNLHQGNRTI
jgi:hypothetical protein